MLGLQAKLSRAVARGVASTNSSRIRSCSLQMPKQRLHVGTFGSKGMVPTLNRLAALPETKPRSHSIPKRPFSSCRMSYAASPVSGSSVTEGLLHAREKPKYNKVLVVGSGGLSIGQAGEFDYSGKLF